VSDLSLLAPGVLWALPIALVLLGLIGLVRRRRFVAATLVRLLAPRAHRASRLRRLPLLFGALALAGLAVALAEPVIPFTEGQVTARGLDIAIVLDLSSSMQETMNVQRPPQTVQNLTFSSRDPRPRRQPGLTRLDTTKAAIIDFIGRRPDDRVGLVVFSDNAYVVSPLTFDHEYLRNYVDLVDDQILRGEGMTAIGEGIALANLLLDRQSTAGERRNRVLVVFTDGEHNFGRDPLDALQESDEAGNRVHVIGVDIEKEIQNKPQVRALIDTVRRYGGRYFSADTEGELREASRTIDEIEKGLIVTSRYQRNSPVYGWFVIPALLLLAVAVLLRAIPYFVDLT
jgi:Ca-activated chloride channel family protein